MQAKKFQDNPLIGSNFRSIEIRIHDVATTDHRQYKLFIDGESRQGSGGVLVSINPYTGQPWAEVQDASAADVSIAVDAARRAFDGPWRLTTPQQRAAMLREVNA
jgi:delta 1-pyrroline-5-carboxylate dehydrogenase